MLIAAATAPLGLQGLKVVPCSQSRTMMEVIRTGMKHRRVGSHQLNMESSRSHSIMTVYCDATPTGALPARLVRALEARLLLPICCLRRLLSLPHARWHHARARVRARAPPRPVFI